MTITTRTPRLGGLAAAVAALLLASASPARAQARPDAAKLEVGSLTLSPEVDVRLRGEYRASAPDLVPTPASAGAEDAWAVLSRARLGLTVERGPLLAKITLQDARALGAGAPDLRFGADPSRPAFGPYEAYLEARTSAARPSFVRLGRQPVMWGEGRLLGIADFSPTGRALDAVRARAVHGDLELEALAAILVAPRPVGAASGDATSPQVSGSELLGVRAAGVVAPLLRIELYGLARVTDGETGRPPPVASFRSAAYAPGEKLTASLRVHGEASDFGYGVEGSAQIGKVRDLAPVAAFALAGRAERRFSRGWLVPTVRVLGGYASGDPGKGGTYTQFDPLLPDTQRWHGALDVFAYSNLADLGAQIDLHPGADTVATVGYRYAHLAEPGGEWIGAGLTSLGRRGPSATNRSGALGHEVSLRLSVEPLPGLTLGLAYAGLALGDGAKDILAGRSVVGSTPASLTHYAFTEARLRFP